MVDPCYGVGKGVRLKVLTQKIHLLGYLGNMFHLLISLNMQSHSCWHVTVILNIYVGQKPK